MIPFIHTCKTRTIKIQKNKNEIHNTSDILFVLYKKIVVTCTMILTKSYKSMVPSSFLIGIYGTQKRLFTLKEKQSSNQTSAFTENIHNFTSLFQITKDMQYPCTYFT